MKSASRSTSRGERSVLGRVRCKQRGARAADGGWMRASVPRLHCETRSEATLDCHTDAILLREGPGAVASTYLRGSGAPARAPGSVPSLPISIGTPTTVSEPPPFSPARSTFPAGGVAIVVTDRRDLQVRRARATSPPPPMRASWPITSAGIFALGAATAASVGELAGRALETAALACILAGVLILLLALLRMGARARPGGKRRAA